MTRIFVTGIGLVTALGQDRETTWTNLLHGKSGIELVELSTIHAKLSGITLPLATVDLRSSHQPRAQRFIEQAVAEAIADAALELPLPDCSVVIGSSRGYQLELEDLIQSFGEGEQITTDRQLAIDNCQLSLKIHNWLNLLPGGLSGAIARQVQTNVTVLAPMAACATGNWAIAQACELIRSGQCTMAIAGAVDAAITPLSIAGFRQLGAMAKTGAYPFSIEREGLVLGEGAAVLILESERSFRQRGCGKVYGQILSFGITNDAYHPTSPGSDRLQAKLAVQLCLRRAKLRSEDVDLISTHGTATQLNDAAEATAIAQIFPHNPLVSATKGATGHALGGTGMMEAAFCLLALQRQTVPPCVGLRSPAFDLNFVRFAQSVQLDAALNFSFGFGGQNAVVAFEKLR